MEPILHIKNKKELEDAYTRYDCNNIKDLSDVLWYNYAVTLILDRKLNTTTYTYE